MGIRHVKDLGWQGVSTTMTCGLGVSKSWGGKVLWSWGVCVRGVETWGAVVLQPWGAGTQGVEAWGAIVFLLFPKTIHPHFQIISFHFSRTHSHQEWFNPMLRLLSS